MIFGDLNLGIDEFFVGKTRNIGEVIFKYNNPDPLEYIAVIFDICKIDSVYTHWLLLTPNIKSI